MWEASKPMPKRLLGPFQGLQNLSGLDIDTAAPLDMLERADLINAVLAGANCNCNGHASGDQRDPYFGADLSEIVARCSLHDVTFTDTDGKTVTVSVKIDISTLMVEVDSNNEVMAWIYEEG